MRKVHFYEIMYNYDQTEGRGPLITTNICFDSKEEAIKFVKTPEYYKKYGVMGSDTSYPEHYVKERDLTIYESIQEKIESSDAYKLSNILSKLPAGEADFVKRMLKANIWKQ